MAPGIGRALARAVQQEGLGEDLAIEGPSLANARRRQLFRYLCLRPCARVGEIARDLSYSQATVRWHEWDLLENGYVQIEGTRVFPAGLIDPEDAVLFASLAAMGRAAVLAATFASPATSYQEVAQHVDLTRQSVSKIAQELSEYGLLNLVEDGRYRRLYPTDRLTKKREGHRPRAAAFGDAVLRRLPGDGPSPGVPPRQQGPVVRR